MRMAVRTPFPNNSFSASNYWVDVVFSPGAVAQPSITTVALSGGLWQLSGSAAAASTITVFDGATQLGTTSANSSSGWCVPDAMRTTALSTTSPRRAMRGPASRAWFEDNESRRLFLRLGGGARRAGGDLRQRRLGHLDLTAPTTLADADFRSCLQYPPRSR